MYMEIQVKWLLLINKLNEKGKFYNTGISFSIV